MNLKDFQRKASRLAGRAAQKGSDLLETGKTKIAIGKEKHAIDELFYKIGETVYDRCRKNGEIPEEWTNPENKNKLAQKDTDAEWTNKNNKTNFVYKDHVKCDADSKLITNYSVTGASVHDSQCCVFFIDEQDKVLYADSAYSGKPIALALPESCENQICEKGYRNNPLTPEQKENNRRKSKIRCRIEHIFGFMTGAMHGITIRSIGITRAWFNIGITNLVYNFCRYGYLKRASA